MNLRHSRPLLAAFLMVAGIVVFVVAALAGAAGLEQARDLAERRARAYQSLVQIESVMSELKDLETGQRGFLITGDEAFLTPYLDARRDLDARYRAMGAAMADMGLEKAFWERLDGLVRDRVSIAEENIRLRRNGQFKENFDLKRLTEGKKVMDAIRVEFGALENRRRAELEAIGTALARGQRLAFLITLAAGLFGLLLMLGSLGLFLREQRLRLDAEAVLASANQRLESEIQARTRDLQVALERIRAFAGELDQGIEAERRRLAREVHDQIGQIFTAMKLLIRPWMEHFAGVDRLQQQFEDFVRLLDQGVTTARRITAELQPPLLEDLGLGAALEHFFTQYGAASGVACRVEVGHDHVLGRVQATALFRIAQEALTNTVRHAAAGRIVISDRLEGHAYHLIIEDDGCGFAAGNQASFGLRGMEERAKLVGGTLILSSRAEGGARVEVILQIVPGNTEVTP